jgi:2-C-methyl-D-erythritol 4-phosphate cytidylyltransferase
LRAAAILLAAGLGERLGADRPKVFLRLGSATLLGHAVATVDACPDVEGLAIAAPPGYEARTTASSPSDKLVGVIAGGDTRQESVRKVLEELPDDFDVVVCHDVARPLAPVKLFSDVLAPLEWADGAVPVVRVSDTVKRLEAGGIAETLPRKDLVLAQTPQAFGRQALWDAHSEARRLGYSATDDAALLEWAGYRVETVSGHAANIKITTPEDLGMAEALLARRDG